uniref:Uncharacterized protein n=1 Tax=Glossina pallidipes TaxID=7398 RepID=A0A1A9ZGH7_GLOPL
MKREGSIGHDLVIKPLPHNLSPNKDKSHHVIYKRETLPLDHLSDFASNLNLFIVNPVCPSTNFDPNIADSAKQWNCKGDESFHEEFSYVACLSISALNRTG